MIKQKNQVLWKNRHPLEATIIIQRYEEIIIAQEKKRVIGYVRKQGQLLKQFKDKEQIFRNVGQRKSTLYFKLGLYKHLQKSPHLKKKSFKATCKNSVILFS